MARRIAEPKGGRRARGPTEAHDWNPAHRLVFPRRGTLVSPRRLEVDGWVPVDAIDFAPSGTAEALSDRLAVLRESLIAEGWTVEPGDPWSPASTLLAERDLRLDLTALRRLRGLQVGFVVEFAAAILLGFYWPTLGYPGWQGEAITALAAVGAVGLVVWLARVDFVSEVLLVFRGASSTGAAGDSPSQGAGVRLRIASARVHTRNWEVLGDRGGRKVVAARSTPESARAAAAARERLE